MFKRLFLMLMFGLLMTSVSFAEAAPIATAQGVSTNRAKVKAGHKNRKIKRNILL